ncbi:Rep [Molossus molossus associated gemykibivirus 1]|nr:Rep [Molossus molossus associated gemykibivirus 1]
MAFRFKRRYALLTYAQCGDLDPHRIVQLLSEMGAECIIGRENHADGGIHLHAFVDFGREYSTRNARCFDVEGHHPNVLPGKKTPEKMFDYATKEGDVVAGGLERPHGSDVHQSRDPWHEIILADTRDGRCLIMQRKREMGLSEWVRDNLEGYQPGRRGKSLVLIGPSRMGKTMWARSLGNHVYFGGLFCLDEFSPDVDYAVFDDIQGGLEFFHGYKFWLGHQQSFFATDKYRGKKLIHWGKPAIWCSNTDPRADKGADADWLDANCEFIFIDSPLWG